MLRTPYLGYEPFLEILSSLGAMFNVCSNRGFRELLV